MKVVIDGVAHEVNVWYGNGAWFAEAEVDGKALTVWATTMSGVVVNWHNAARLGRKYSAFVVDGGEVPR